MPHICPLLIELEVAINGDSNCAFRLRLSQVEPVDGKAVSAETLARKI